MENQDSVTHVKTINSMAMDSNESKLVEIPEIDFKRECLTKSRRVQVNGMIRGNADS